MEGVTQATDGLLRELEGSLFAEVSEWSLGEQHTLEQRNVEFAQASGQNSGISVEQCLSISSQLPNKTARDVALRLKWLAIMQHQGDLDQDAAAAAEEEPPLRTSLLSRRPRSRRKSSRQSSFKLPQVTRPSSSEAGAEEPSEGDGSCGPLPLQPQQTYTGASAYADSCPPEPFEDLELQLHKQREWVAAGAGAAGSSGSEHEHQAAAMTDAGTSVISSLMNQNYSILASFKANMAQCKVMENTELLLQYRDNLVAALENMAAMPGVMSTMPPLPVEPSLKAASSFLPPMRPGPLAGGFGHRPHPQAAQGAMPLPPPPPPPPDLPQISPFPDLPQPAMPVQTLPMDLNTNPMAVNADMASTMAPRMSPPMPHTHLPQIAAHFPSFSQPTSASTTPMSVPQLSTLAPNAQGSMMAPVQPSQGLAQLPSFQQGQGTSQMPAHQRLHQGVSQMAPYQYQQHLMVMHAQQQHVVPIQQQQQQTSYPGSAAPPHTHAPPVSFPQSQPASTQEASQEQQPSLPRVHAQPASFQEAPQQQQAPSSFPQSQPFQQQPSSPSLHTQPQLPGATPQDAAAPQPHSIAPQIHLFQQLQQSQPRLLQSSSSHPGTLPPPSVLAAPEHSCHPNLAPLNLDTTGVPSQAPTVLAALDPMHAAQGPSTHQTHEAQAPAQAAAHGHAALQASPAQAAAHGHAAPLALTAQTSTGEGPTVVAN